MSCAFKLVKKLPAAMHAHRHHPVAISAIVLGSGTLAPLSLSLAA
jgi:hypothetical protein